MTEHPQPARGRFPKSAKVRKRREYLRVQERAARANSRHFVFLIAARDDAEGPPGPRLGITASRRVGSAVVRNRAKRLVREAFRASRGLFAAEVDVVVIVRQPLADLSVHDVIAEWRGAERAITRAREHALRTAGRS